jgi:hypothetical protein
VLFDGEWSRVKRDTKEGNFRRVKGPQFAHGERQKQGNGLGLHRRLDSALESTKMTERKLKTNHGDIDSRVSEKEKLLCARNDNGEEQANDPCTECRHRHCRIVSVGHRRSDFRVRGFIFGSDNGRVKVGVVSEGLEFSRNM